ncbi:MAG: branched-chain-amino-acid transaminase [Gammaproteobacteria bacterium]|nr:branched-chain-amino-acid transaminase [Gammaproteobacteria bacterium]
MSTTRYWINGQHRDEADAVIPVTDHGLLYGDGVFEGIRFYQRQPFYRDAHLERLWDSAQSIRLKIPNSRAQLSEVIDTLVKQFPEPEGYIRILVTRGRGPLGIDPNECGTPNVILIVDQLNMLDETTRQSGIRTIIASTRRIPSDSLDSRIKSLNYLNQILARMEAQQAGVDEAILLNHSGYISEASVENLFIVKQGMLLTPPATDGALDGITRRVVMQLATHRSIPVSEKSLTPYDLYTADECFLTGTGAELIPVREVDGRLIGKPGPVFHTLLGAFLEETGLHQQMARRI